MNGCEAIRENLCEWLDNELPVELRAEVDAHLRQCESCRTEMEELRVASGAVQELPKLKAPSGLLPSIREEIKAEAAQETPSTVIRAGEAFQRKPAHPWTRGLVSLAAFLAMGVLVYTAITPHVPSTTTYSDQHSRADAKNEEKAAPTPAAKVAADAANAPVDIAGDNKRPNGEFERANALSKSDAPRSIDRAESGAVAAEESVPNEAKLGAKVHDKAGEVGTEIRRRSKTNETDQNGELGAALPEKPDGKKDPADQAADALPAKKAEQPAKEMSEYLEQDRQQEVRKGTDELSKRNKSEPEVSAAPTAPAAPVASSKPAEPKPAQNAAPYESKAEPRAPESATAGIKAAEVKKNPVAESLQEQRQQDLARDDGDVKAEGLAKLKEKSDEHWSKNDEAASKDRKSLRGGEVAQDADATASAGQDGMKQSGVAPGAGAGFVAEKPQSKEKEVVQKAAQPFEGGEAFKKDELKDHEAPGEVSRVKVRSAQWAAFTRDLQRKAAALGGRMQDATRSLEEKEAAKAPAQSAGRVERLFVKIPSKRRAELLTALQTMSNRNLEEEKKVLAASQEFQANGKRESATTLEANANMAEDEGKASEQFITIEILAEVAP